MSKKIRVPDLLSMKTKGQKICCLTAYDYTTASLVDQSGVDLILVGDSLGMVVQGNENTLSVTLDEMIYHTKMVSRAVRNSLIVVDMPFMTYQVCSKEALRAAGRLVQEAGAEALKLEGASEDVLRSISKISRSGIPVMGHVGLRPQAFHEMGGHRMQGRSQEEREQVLKDALLVEEAGAFSVVLESIPNDLAEEVTSKLSVPTIGIGAGSKCSGQVLVVNDVIGFHPSANASVPKFVKQYVDVKSEIISAVSNYVSDVRSESFPGSQTSYCNLSPKIVSQS